VLFNVKYIKLHCTNPARFLPTIYHQTALRKTCANFADNLLSDNAGQEVLRITLIISPIYLYTPTILFFCFGTSECISKMAIFRNVEIVMSDLNSESSNADVHIKAIATQNLLDFCCQFAV